ncbi:MAG: hypothetical protein ACYSSP_05215 [Planctomycetota bacterium]|jgi:hypothetical protein
METKEKRNDEKEFAGWPNMSCCGTQGSPQTIPDCCKSIGEDDNCRSMMSKCMKGCRWFPVIPVIFGISLLLLGYFLNPEITRILWMIAAGFVAMMGVFGFVMMNKMKQIARC